MRRAWTIADNGEASFLGLGNYELHHGLIAGGVIGTIVLLYYLVFRDKGRYRYPLPW